jgi:6-phospho-3-hexuloisomerase
MEALVAGQNILQELITCFNKLSPARIDQLMEEIQKAKRIFCVGAGRSRIMLNAFCMRLNQLGFESYVAGNIPCPPARTGDLVIAASGSGTTPSVTVILKRAKEAGARVILITAASASSLADMADLVVNIEAPNGLINDTEKGESRQIMRTLFEQACFILQEAIIAALSADIPPEEIVARHTNLE